MKVTALKRRLIYKISKSQDDELLNDLDAILKDDSKKEVYQLSRAQQMAIREAREQVKRGEILSDAEVRKRTAQWLGNCLVISGG
jgi:hypothetical protein